MFLNKLLYCSPDPAHPVYNSAVKLVNRMADLFTQKIRKTRIDLETTSQSQDTVTDDTMQTDPIFSEFKTLSDTNVAKLIKKSATKSCILDPIQTWTLKQCLDVLLPVITQIINLSLSTGVMPDNLKHAILIPLRNIPLDPETNI